MKTFIEFIYLLIALALLASRCTQKIEVTLARQNPIEVKKDFDYNLNHAKHIVNYTQSHKKARERIAQHNREVRNEEWHRLNARKTEHKHDKGAFRFYRNN